MCSLTSVVGMHVKDLLGHLQRLLVLLRLVESLEHNGGHGVERGREHHQKPKTPQKKQNTKDTFSLKCMRETDSAEGGREQESSELQRDSGFHAIRERLKKMDGCGTARTSARLNMAPSFAGSCCGSIARTWTPAGGHVGGKKC